MGRVTSVFALALGALLAQAPGSQAAEPPLGLTDCEQLEATYRCSGLVETWDGVPLDTTLTLPEEGARGLPLIAELHGFGNSKWEYLDPASKAYTDNAYGWAREGYAVLTFTARGLWGSCGTPEARLARPVDCADGYIHLADVRYEVRDAQELIGRLVDDGVADENRIGVTGDSYGGGQTLMLAALRDRVMAPDGSYVKWRSPAGTALEVAAAAPVIPWSDLVTAAAPSGRVSSTRVTSRKAATDPVGVTKATVVSAIFAAAEFAVGPGQPVGEPFVPGRPMGFLNPLDPEANVPGWVARAMAGEPYSDAEAQGIVGELTRYHSAYYVKPDRPPPPLFLSSGFADDLFPADEVLRFANRTRKRFPNVPVSMLLGDFGHQRAANKQAERDRLVRNLHRFFDHRLKGEGRGLRPGVVAYAQTCPRAEPSLGPFRARSFRGLAGGTVRRSFEVPDTVVSASGDPTIGRALDPVSGGGDSCVETDATAAPGTVRFKIGDGEGDPFTMLGAPVLRADLDVRGAEPHVAQLAGRLWDVAPGGRQRLVARGSYRPEQGANRWELHPGAWRFERGHSAVLELLGSDAPFGRPSNGVFTIEVSDLRVRLPARR